MRFLVALVSLVLAVAVAASGQVYPPSFSSSPAHPRVLVVSQDGAGDYTSIKAAADFIAAVPLGERRSDTVQWIIRVMPGVYVEDAFTLTGWVSLACDMPLYANNTGGLDARHTSIKNSTSVTSGAFITLQGAVITGCEIILDGTPTGALVAVEADLFWGNLFAMTIQLLADAATHPVRAMASSGAASLAVSNVLVNHYGTSQANAVSVYTEGAGLVDLEDVKMIDTGGAPRAAIEHTSSSTAILRSASVGRSTSPATFDKDLINGGSGTVRIQGLGNRYDPDKVSGAITREELDLIRLRSVTADPCALSDSGAIFYNQTAGHWCGCNNSGVDVQIHSPATACF